MTDETMLGLFKEQLEAECRQIGADQGIQDRGKQLIWWYFMRLHGFSPTEVESVACDGGGDLGIDAIWIDDDTVVRFYQFKNVINPSKPVAAGDVDKLISGLQLILSRKHDKIANQFLRSLVEDIYQQVPTGYSIHVVTSGNGIPQEASVKLDAFVSEMTSGLFKWAQEPLGTLQDRFYAQTLPAIEDPIVISVESPPCVIRSGLADGYFFAARGHELAQLYEEHGEGLLQRNIRVNQGNTATNRSIEETSESESSANFVHFNNGVSLICHEAVHDQFQRTVTLTKAQIVNGGQTIRAIHRAFRKASLKDDVVVPVRAITGSFDKNFANEVAVNQNNQNRMGTGFLRSNDARVVQLDHALAALGWYLERRDRELESATDEERSSIEQKLGQTLEGHVIRMRDGLQAYVATFFEHPELAKKNPKKIYLSVDDGGYFESVFSQITAEKMIVAHHVKQHVDGFVRRFSTKKRRKERVPDWRTDYKELLGGTIVEEFGNVIDQVMPQCAVFLCGTVFQDFVKLRCGDPAELPGELARNGDDLLRTHILRILRFAENNPRIASKSWPTLLKSMTFFNHIVSDMKNDVV
jgi:hypothetical protein